MKSLISLGLLIALPFLFIAQPSFSKETWLKCVRKTFDGKPSQETKTYAIKLDSINQRYEIQGGVFESTIIQGKANYFTSTIQIKFVEQEPPLTFSSTFKINRSNLTYSGLTETSGYTNYSSIQAGSCKVIPAPSSKTNKI